jgi:hypothetical protein
MPKKFAATVLITAAISLPLAVTAPAATADPIASGSAAASVNIFNTLVRELGLGGLFGL